MLLVDDNDEDDDVSPNDWLEYLRRVLILLELERLFKLMVEVLIIGGIIDELLYVDAAAIEGDDDDNCNWGITCELGFVIVVVVESVKVVEDDDIVDKANIDDGFMIDVVVMVVDEGNFRFWLVLLFVIKAGVVNILSPAEVGR